jgi:DsbC/DsbD-like thiol-disulfide interchange protein
MRMNARFDRSLPTVLCAVAFALGAAVDASANEDVTPWDGDARSAVRMIAGARPAGAAYLRAGIEMRLMRGWHTYWRYPGDSGVPPQFSFDGSRNLKEVSVLWPAPARKLESGGTSIGYSTSVIFPLRIIALEANKPVVLRLRSQYAICEKICVPAEARNELHLAGSRASQDAALRAAEARVPVRQNLGDAGALAIRSMRRERGAGGRDRAVVDVAGPATVDLFVEGPTEQWALPVPTAVDGAPPGHRRFVFDLDGAPAGEDYPGALLRLTAVAADRSIEVAIRLD